MLFSRKERPRKPDAPMPPEHKPKAIRAGAFADRMATANAIADQIWREQELVSTRMTWNFNFQTFLVGLFVFAGSSLDGGVRLATQTVIGGAGLLVIYSIYRAVRAAQEQSTRLKRHWINEFCKDWREITEPGTCNVVSGPFPQPFSMKHGSSKGRSASIHICVILGCMWLCLIGVAVYAFHYQKGESMLKLELTTKRGL